MLPRNDRGGLLARYPDKVEGREVEEGPRQGGEKAPVTTRSTSYFLRVRYDASNLQKERTGSCFPPSLPLFLCFFSLRPTEAAARTRTGS